MLRYYFHDYSPLSYYFQNGLPRRCVGFLRSQDRIRTCKSLVIILHIILLNPYPLHLLQ
jgi:hypothetical protein